MKRSFRFIFTLLISSCFFSSCVVADYSPVRLLVGKREIPTSPTAVFDGARILVPFGVLKSLGVNYAASADGKTVAVIATAEKSADFPVRAVDDTPMVSLDDVLKLVGGDAVVDPENRTVSVRGQLTSVEFTGDLLRFNCTIPVVCSVSRWTNRLIVDIPAAKLTTEAREVYVGGDVVTKIRLGQYSDDTVRVVLELAKQAGYKIETALPSSQITIRVAQDLPIALPRPSTPPGGCPPFGIVDIRIENVSDTQFDLVIDTSRKGTADISKSAFPSEVTVFLKGGTLSKAITQVTGTHPMLSNARFAQASTAPALARIHMNLKRPVLSELKIEDNSIRIGVRLPDKAGGTLAGKLVVIDPGHGGKQPGAIAGEVKEKDVNLKLAAALATALEKAGVRTIFTRTKDTSMDLAPRPAVATANNADFFISLHCNSNLKPNSRSGIETYYYRNGDSPPLLAQAVQKAVCSATGMRDGCARDCGFMVLRLLDGTGIPGILVECGYLNHSKDRAKLLDEKYRNKLAEGIVAGLRAYVEGTPL